MKGSEKKPKTATKEGKHIPAYQASEKKESTVAAISNKKK